jgi:hypothetical protein
MDFTGLTWHEATVALAVVLGPVGCLVSLGYVLRVEHRDSWRRPMLVTAILGGAAVLAAYVTGERVLDAEPGLSESIPLQDHRDYALQLLLPTVGWLVMAIVTGWVNPRTGALKVMLPLLLTGFSLIVLVLVVLSGSDGARELWETILGELR